MATPSGRGAAVSNGNGMALGQQQQLQPAAQQQQRGKGVDDSSNKLRKVSGRLFGEPSARSGALPLLRLFWPGSFRNIIATSQPMTSDNCEGSDAGISGLCWRLHTRKTTNMM